MIRPERLDKQVGFDGVPLPRHPGTQGCTAVEKVQGVLLCKSAMVANRVSVLNDNLLLLGPGRPSAGWAPVDRREGTVLMSKFLTPLFSKNVT